MTVETVTYIDDLDDTYPAESETGTLHEGNNHIRNIKTGLLNSLPNIAGAMTASHTELNILDGATVTTAQLNALATLSTEEVAYLDITTLGESEASKVVTANANHTIILDTGSVLALNGDLTVHGIAVAYQKLYSPTLMTAQACSGESAIDFTSIPAWVRKITIMLSGVSLSGTDDMLVQLGSGGAPESSDYSSGESRVAAATYGFSASDGSGFFLYSSVAAKAETGTVTLTNMTGNTWLASWVLYYSNGACAFGAGGKTLAAALDMVRIKPDGSNTFDAGTINVMYE
jgi:hypothetical protein